MREALEQIRDLRARLAQAHGQSHEPIAIVGMACRFPGDAEDLDGFWDVLAAGRNMVSALPADRFDLDALYDADPDAPGRTNVRHGGFLRDIAGFDPQFFAIAPLEAEAMDPQQRLLLESCWHALEDAAIAPASLHGTDAGVFVGIGSSDYALLRARQQPLTAVDAHLALGTSHSVASGRLSYVLGLRGPSYAVDTACSSSLVAVHLAVQSLRARECSLALAGGVAALLAPDYFINFSHARMLATDGRCKTFAAAADGYVRGEGCGLVVLKRLADALAAGDRVRAVIRGSATNQDGRSSGLTAPNGPAQEDVIRAALADGQVDPLAVDYVEAHGTGTPLGDPIEVQALGAVLCAGRGREQPAAACFGEDQSRTSRGRLGRRRPHEDGAGPRTRTPADAPALRRTQSAHRLAEAAHRGAEQRSGLAARHAAAPRRRQLVRFQRHQRPRDPRGGAGRRPGAGAGARHGARVPLGAHRERTARARAGHVQIARGASWALAG